MELTTETIQNRIKNQEQTILKIREDSTQLFGDRFMRQCNSVIQLSDDHKIELERLAGLCMSNFVMREATKINSCLQIPTLLARIDCTIDSSGVRIFECDERPAGAGITNQVLKSIGHQGINKAVHLHFVEYIEQSPLVLKHPDILDNDDCLIFSVAELPANKLPTGPIIVRGEPTHFADHPLKNQIVEQSVSTVLSEGDKHYALLVPELSAAIASPSKLPDGLSSFAIKPTRGSKGNGVMVYLNPEDRQIHGHKGIVTLSKMIRAIKSEPDGSLIQEVFKPPIIVSMPGDKIGNLIMRLFVLISPGCGSEIIGGAYVARSELIVHGASNSIMGPVITN